MEKVYYTAREHIKYFKLEFCCWFAPVRVGLLFVGYINIIIDIVCIMGIANDGMMPTIMKVQDTLFTDNVSKPIPVLAYAIEMSFNVILLCAIYRRDVILLRTFLYYTIVALVMSIMTYSMVLAAVAFHVQFAIVASILFQLYCVLLIRSVMVEFKMDGKTYELPRLTMSSILKDKGTPCIYDPKEGKIQEITIGEVPKKQEVQITVIGPDNKVKDNEISKATDVTDLKKIGDTKKDDVKVQIETKDDNTKDSKKIQEEKKKEQKKIQEEKKAEEKKIKEEKKKEEKKIKEEKKKSKDDKKITSLILKKYKDDKEAENDTKNKDPKDDFKEIPLQTTSEHPK